MPLVQKSSQTCYNNHVNKFYVILFIVIIGIFTGIFVITQKDALINNMKSQNPSDALIPSNPDILQIMGRPSPVLGQSTVNTEPTIAPTFGVEEGVQASYSATITTSKGDIKITLDGTDAPKTVLNFINKAKSGFYNNLTFHRVEDWVIQGGDPSGNGTGGGLMRTEINSQPFIEGSLGVARGGNINVSNDSQFFITKKEASWLNNQYTNFGIVTEGMGVINKIEIGDKILGITIDQ